MDMHNRQSRGREISSAFGGDEDNNKEVEEKESIIIYWGVQKYSGHFA